jgi:hypothetical protein
VSGATKTMQKYKGHKNLGAFLTPRTGNSLKTLEGFIWACYNSAFNGFNKKLFIKMLDRIKNQKFLFVPCPDKVGDSNTTLKLFYEYYPIIKSYNFPIALVLQDGMDVKSIPFDKIDAIFIGGSTEYKLGEEVREIVKKSKQLNKWIHMGRVNFIKRLKYAHSIGCDSVDGSGFSMFPEKMIPPALLFLENLTED